LRKRKAQKRRELSKEEGLKREKRDKGQKKDRTLPRKKGTPESRTCSASLKRAYKGIELHPRVKKRRTRKKGNH